MGKFDRLQRFREAGLKDGAIGTSTHQRHQLMKSIAGELVTTVTIEQNPESIVSDTLKHRTQNHRLRRIEQPRIHHMTSQIAASPRSRSPM